METSVLETATIKERFELLYARLSSLHTGAGESVFKATAALLLVTGWVVTSDSARSQLTKDPASRWLVILGVLLYAVLFAISAYRVASMSAKVDMYLAELAYVPKALYDHLVISPPVTFGYIVVNTILSIAVCIFVYRIAG